jgi:hypothetical protein
MNELNEYLDTLSNDNQILDGYVFDYYLKTTGINYEFSFTRPYTSTFAKLCGALLEGYDLPDDTQLWFDQNSYNIQKQLKICKEGTQEAPGKDSRAKSILDYAQNIINDLEASVDDFIESSFSVPLNPKAIMRDRVKRVHANHILSHFQILRNEVHGAWKKEDEDLIEAYSHFTDYQKKKLIVGYDKIIVLCIDIIEMNKRTRKPRKKKEKSLDDLVSKVKYCEEIPEFNLVSIHPREVIGAQQVWIYNKEYKKFGCYYAHTGAGLTIKGTTIQDFVESRSLQRIVRKPKEVLTRAMKGGNMYLTNEYKALKTTEHPLTGRLNSDVLILRVIK